MWPGDTAFPDFSLPETRERRGRLDANRVRFGIAGIWNDMNEPSTFNGNLEAMRFQHGQVTHARFHNECALLMAMDTVEGLYAHADRLSHGRRFSRIPPPPVPAPVSRPRGPTPR